jgi:hypothetical protein
MFRRLLLYSLPLRGAKKGKGKGEEVKIEATTDIINIYKDGKDPERLPKSEYPPWLFGLVDSYSTHPVTFADQMYKGQQETFNYVDLKRLFKFSKRHYIHSKNRFHPHLDPFKKDDFIQDEIPGGEDTDIDPDDCVVPILKIAFGGDPKGVVAEQLQRVREELGLIKKNT